MTESTKPRCSMCGKPSELANRDSLLEHLNKMLKDSQSMSTRKRHSLKRCKALKSMSRTLTQHQEVLMAQQVTLKQMRLALDQELKYVTTLY